MIRKIEASSLELPENGFEYIGNVTFNYRTGTRIYNVYSSGESGDMKELERFKALASSVNGEQWPSWQ